MNILLDTHIAIWALNDDPLLPAKARELIADPDNTIYISAVSVWEIHLKHNRRPENIPFNESLFSEACNKAGYIQLPLYGSHVLALKTINRPESSPAHNDPFDRLLIAQAKAEKMSFLTHDELIKQYDEKTIIGV